MSSPWTIKQQTALKNFFCDSANAEYLKNHKTRYQHIADFCFVEEKPLGIFHKKDAIKNKINEMKKHATDDGLAIGKTMEGAN